jgi:hypothetical protein
VFLIFLEINYYINIGTLEETPYKYYIEILQYLIISVLVFYALFPTLISSKRYFDRQSFGSLVVEYHLLKRLICIGTPLLVLVLLVFFGQENLEKECFVKSEFKPLKPICYSYTVLPAITLIVGGSIVRFVSNISKRDFRYYYARGCFQVSQDQNESEKMTYLNRALNSYDKYLKRNLKLQISNTAKITSKIISDAAREQYDITASISHAFLHDNKLKPIEYMLNLMDLKKTENFLVKELMLNKIKESGTFFAAIIPVIISIIKLIQTGLS